MLNAIDLHLHTRASDGQWTPSGLVARAKANGIGTIAITDHDATISVKPSQRCALTAGIRVIPGVEVTAHWRGKPLHLLLYGEAVLGEPLASLLARGRAAIDRWARDCASSLPEPGVRARILGSIDRLAIRDVVRAARECGVARDLHQAARVIATFRPHDPPGLALPEVARAALDVGAVPILAHPMRTGSLTCALDEAELNALLDDVPAVLGIEVGHPRHCAEAQEALASLAARRAILVTAGSDSHGSARARPPMAWPEEIARDFLTRVR